MAMMCSPSTGRGEPPLWDGFVRDHTLRVTVYRLQRPESQLDRLEPCDSATFPSAFGRRFGAAHDVVDVRPWSEEAECRHGEQALRALRVGGGDPGGLLARNIVLLGPAARDDRVLKQPN